MDDLEAVLGRAPDALWIMINADLGLDRAAVGMRESARRDRFLNSFVDVFYFRNLVSFKKNYVSLLLPTYILLGKVSCGCGLTEGGVL